jgi:hypothetical protein
MDVASFTLVIFYHFLMKLMLLRKFVNTIKQ